MRLSSSYLGENSKTSDEFLSEERSFLWFFGYGAIHKGLDLVLEAFARNPQWTLHVVSSVGEEKDFVKMYGHELYELPNIHYHGQLSPSGQEFGEIVRQCSAFIA